MNIYKIKQLASEELEAGMEALVNQMEKEMLDKIEKAAYMKETEELITIIEIAPTEIRTEGSAVFIDHETGMTSIRRFEIIGKAKKTEQKEEKQ
jgi:hypothetical protein